MNTLSVEQLQTWLVEGRPVTVLDVRPTEQRAEWAIPGSIHLDAYCALNEHDAHALDAFQATEHVPVVTVCAAGRTSQLAVEQLAARSILASSLEGGMKAWSLAWNTADVSLDDSPAQVIQVRRTGKGCLSYLIGAGKEAFVLDASLDPQVYPVPFDAVPIVTTLGGIEEQVSLLHTSRTTFVQTILARIPAIPPNYQRIVTYNERGLLPESEVTELEAGANRCAIS